MGNGFGTTSFYFDLRPSVLRLRGILPILAAKNLKSPIYPIMEEVKKITRIAIIAHDARKADMVAFLHQHLRILTGIEIVATGTTGSHVARSGLTVDAKLSGPLGGDAQIAAMVAEGTVQAVIFFRDPLGKHPHEPDVQMLMRICDVHNIPLATNPATAHLVLMGIENQSK